MHITLVDESVSKFLNVMNDYDLGGKRGLVGKEERNWKLMPGYIRISWWMNVAIGWPNEGKVGNLYILRLLPGLNGWRCFHNNYNKRILGNMFKMFQSHNDLC